MSIKRPLPAGSPLAFGESVTKGCIKNVLNNKKPAFWIVCGAVVVVVVAMVLLLTNPVQLLELPNETSVIVWAYVPGRSSVFPAMPIRFDIPFSSAHVTVDGGRLLLNDGISNRIDCGKEANCPASGYLLWMPLEYGASGSDDAVTGCILRFDITNDDGSPHKGTIHMEQLDKKERGVWYYNVSLAQTDTGLILVESDEPGGRCILKLP